MNRYETVFIMTPVLSEEQAKETVEKFKSLIKDNGGKIVHEDHWGLRKLAYPIQKKTTGFYQLLEFEYDTQKLAELELEFRREERVIRFLTTKMEKHHITYAESRRSQTSTTKAPQPKVKA